VALFIFLISFPINLSPVFAQTPTTNIAIGSASSPAVIGVVNNNNMPVFVRVNDVNNETGLAGFSFKVSYNPNLISIPDSNNDYIADTGTVTLGSFLGGSGKQTACSDAFIQIDLADSTKKFLTFTCGTYGTTTAVKGSGILATINFRTGNTLATTPLRFVNAQLADNTADASLIPAVPRDGNAVIAKCANVDGSLDGKVMIGDILAVVNHYSTSEALYDLNGNGVVQVDDILLAVGQYSQICH